MASSSEPVTRIASFRFRENVTAEQKGDRARAFLKLYEQHQDLILAMPVGGRPLNTPLNLTNVKRDDVWDMLFTSEEARLKFDGDAGHDDLKRETDPLLAQVFVYDYKIENNLGW